MLYAKIINGAVADYPYSLAKLQAENPNVSFPKQPTDELLTEYNVLPVVAIAQPSPTLTQEPVEQTPQIVNGQWTQVWAMVDVSPEEAARRQQAAQDETDNAAVKADTFVQNFIAMTPAQVSAYVENNTANLAQVRSLLTKMALMLLALARRQYR
jgi:hypothetical protein